MSNTIRKAILEALKLEDQIIAGNLIVSYNDQNSNKIEINGDLTTSLTPAKVGKLISKALFSINEKYTSTPSIKFNKNSLSIVEIDEESNPSSVSTLDEDRALDEIRVLFQGDINFNSIKTTESFKRVNFETFEHFRLIYEAFGFMQPIVVDRNLKIIDGMLRYEVFRATHGKKETPKLKLPVIVVDVDGPRADIMRLLLNRLPEFQRWIHSDVDNFVDANSYLQALLEPLGFFGTQMFTPSFYGNTIVEYHLDEFNDQMKAYSQDIGLEAWAKDRKADRDAAEAKRLTQKEEKINKASAPKMRSLFSLSTQIVEKSMELKTTDPEIKVADHVDEMKEVADVITANFDVERRAIKEASGQAWQTGRRTSKALAKEKRVQAEESLKIMQSEKKAIEKLLKSEQDLDEKLSLESRLSSISSREEELLQKLNDAQVEEMNAEDLDD